MFGKFLAAFVIIPLMELILLIKLGNIIGIWLTLLLVVFTGVAGVILARQQGFLLLYELRRVLDKGEMPGNQLLEGVLLLAGALLLLTPGLITDTAGFLLLLPVTRKAIREIIKESIWHYLKTGKIRLLIRYR